MIIDGKLMAAANEEVLKNKIETLGIKPVLLIASCDPDNASGVYMRNKKKACERLGIECRIVKIDPEKDTNYLIEKINEWNENPKISGIIVQLPIPKHFDVKAIQRAISPIKDVDGFHPESEHLPCTPDGVMKMIQNFNLDGKRCVVIGRSDIVGKPLAKLLLEKNATVTTCHSHTDPEHLLHYCRYADFIFCAAGVPGLIRPEHLHYGQTVVVDISINRDKNGNLCGDLHPDAISFCMAYTPVPGGVGPMTVNTLMAHAVDACLKLKEKDI